MLIEKKPGRTIYRCDVCNIIKDVQANKKNRTAITHCCIECHARKNAVRAGQTMAEKYQGSGHFESLGKRLREWHASNPEKSAEVNHANGIRAVAAGLPSVAGYIGGRVTSERGHLNKASPLGHTSEAKTKRYNTLRQRGKLWSSKAENDLETRLRALFENVVHWTTDGGFSIDFYVQDVDCYVQLDGVYWHGLDRPYEELHPGPRAKFERDRKCDAHFQSVGKRLVRITDVAFYRMSNEELKALLTS